MKVKEVRAADLPAHFEHDPHTIFVLDRSFRLIYCNSAWEKFARENGGQHLLREKLIGCNVIEATPAPLKSCYLSIYDRVLSGGEEVQHMYECSSPETYRQYQMRLARKSFPDHGVCIAVSNALVLERPMRKPSEGFDPEELRDADGLIVMCSHCRKAKAPGAEGGSWVFEAELVRTMPPGISHGLCPVCLDIIYGSMRPGPANAPAPGPG